MQVRTDVADARAIIGVALGIASRARAEVRDGLLALSGGFLLIVVGAVGLHAQRSLWRWRS
jgi:hypothetical protein